MVVARVRALNTARLQKRLVVARVRAPRSARQRQLRRSVYKNGLADFVSFQSTKTSTEENVWQRKGRQRTRKGRRQTPPEGAARQHPGHYEACHSPSGTTWRCEAYLRSHLRRDSRCAQGLPRERHPR